MDIKAVDIEAAKQFGYLKELENNKLNDNELIILKSLSDEFKFKENQDIIFTDSMGYDHTLKVKYIISNDYLFGASYKKTILVNLETYKNILNIEELHDYIYQVRTNKELSNDEKNLLIENGKKIGLNVKVNEKSNSLFNIIKNELGFYNEDDSGIAILLLIVILGIIVIYFINNSLVKIVLNERLPVSGTFRSVGADKQKINFILLLEMITYGIIAGLISSVIGWYISKLIMGVIVNNSMLYGSITINYIETLPICIIASVLVNIILQVFISFKDIINSNNISIKDNIFNKYDNLYEYKKYNLIIGIALLLFGIISILFKDRNTFLTGIIALICLFISYAKILPFFTKFVLEKIKIKDDNMLILSKNNAIYGKIQMSCSVIIGTIVIIMTLLLSIANGITLYYKEKDNNENYDLVVTDLNVTSYKRSLINNLDAVDHSYNYNYNYFTLGTPDETSIGGIKFNSIILIYIDNYLEAKVINKKLKDIDYNLANNLKENEILINKSFLDKYKLEIGDFIYITTIMKEGNFDIRTPIYSKVVGTHNLDTNNVIISNDMFEKLRNSFYYAGETYYKLKKGYNVNEVKKQMELILYGDSINNGYDTIKTKEKYMEFENPSEVRNTIIGICILLTILSMICLINNQKVSFMQRKKEFATLYSICMSKSQLKQMITIEFIVSYIITILLALIYSFIFEKIVINFIEVFFENAVLFFRTPYLHGLILVTLLFLIILFICSRIVKNIDKLDIVEEIKYE